MNRPGGKTRQQGGLRPEQAVDGANQGATARNQVTGGATRSTRTLLAFEAHKGRHVRQVAQQVEAVANPQRFETDLGEQIKDFASAKALDVSA